MSQCLNSAMLDRKGGLSSSWRDWLPAALLLAVLLAGATVAQRRTTVAAALLRLFPGTAPPDARTPACNLRHLDGMVQDGDFTWSCGGTACNTTGSRAAQPRLESSRCKLRRFTPVEARKCLAGRPLVMIGDSLTRRVPAFALTVASQWRHSACLAADWRLSAAA